MIKYICLKVAGSSARMSDNTKIRNKKWNLFISPACLLGYDSMIIQIQIDINYSYFSGGHEAPWCMQFILNSNVILSSNIDCRDHVEAGHQQPRQPRPAAAEVWRVSRIPQDQPLHPDRVSAILQYTLLLLLLDLWRWRCWLVAGTDRDRVGRSVSAPSSPFTTRRSTSGHISSASSSSWRSSCGTSCRRRSRAGPRGRSSASSWSWSAATRSAWSCPLSSTPSPHTPRTRTSPASSWTLPASQPPSLLPFFVVSIKE